MFQVLSSIIDEFMLRDQFNYKLLSMCLWGGFFNQF